MCTYTLTLTATQLPPPAAAAAAAAAAVASLQVGHTHTLTAELRLKPNIPARSAPKQRTAGPKQELGVDASFPPVPGALLTFFRSDHPSLAKVVRPNLKAQQSSAIPLSEGEYVEFANATTSKDGKAIVTLESPPAEGWTDIQVVYTDSDGNNTTASSSVVWYPPVPLPTIAAASSSTTAGDANNITVTLYGEDGLTLLVDTEVTFDISGDAFVEEQATQKARGPSTRDASVTRWTDAQGQATIILRSYTAGSSIVTAYFTDPNGRRVSSPPLTISWADPNPNPNPNPSFSRIALRPRYQDSPVRRPVQLSALVLDASEAPVKGVTVRFTITPVSGPNGHPTPDQAAATTTTAVTTTAAATAAGASTTGATATDTDTDTDTATAAGPATEQEAISDESGRAVITLQSSKPGRIQVVASAENSLGQVIYSRPAFVRFYPAGYGDYPNHHHDSSDYHHDHYPKGGSGRDDNQQPHRDHDNHVIDSRKHGWKHGNRR
jgi:hypothetical protein